MHSKKVSFFIVLKSSILILKDMVLLQLQGTVTGWVLLFVCLSVCFVVFQFVCVKNSNCNAYLRLVLPGVALYILLISLVSRGFCYSFCQCCITDCFWSSKFAAQRSQFFHKERLQALTRTILLCANYSTNTFKI